MSAKNNENFKTTDICSENLLNAWLNMYVSIRGNRLVSVLPFNEILILNILYHSLSQKEALLTATDLCQRTQLLKSQINRLLTALEQKGFIERFRSQTDKRKVYIQLSPDKLPIYLEQHQEIINLLKQVFLQMGEEKTASLTALLTEATAIIMQQNTVLKGEN